VTPKPLASKQSGLPKGVYYSRNRTKYMVRVHRDGHVKCLGTYDTPEQASAVYVDYITTYPHGPRGPSPKNKRKATNDFTGTWLNGL
jgi:hypothetical protein